MTFRVLTYAAITAAVVGGMSSCFALQDDRTRTVGYGVSETVRTLVIEGGTGDIRVIGGGTGVQVTERQTYRSTPPATTHSTAGGTLTLGYTCPDGDCGVGYEVAVPAGTEVRVKDGTGDVHLSGLSGRVEAKSGTGSIEARRMSGAEVSLSTSTGDVSAVFTAQPETLAATTSTGSITVKVPGRDPYAVAAKTDTGKSSVTVSQQSDAKRRITATTDTGDVTVTGV
ncbi:DUF4097 family beta strand repeat-containing protein [Saccharothrix sp. ST-888]|uniref:DUF4097 family beta strand repeat-containing protein n=1 Tax=Saccharothrix sp. ST-888 TaxID=1427391 RepID=UPI0018CD59C1|nr:DUF4097 family beta strand repeat-containing protein [Saccharothrix sp. ST-888]